MCWKSCKVLELNKAVPWHFARRYRGEFTSGDLTHLFRAHQSDIFRIVRVTMSIEMPQAERPSRVPRPIAFSSIPSGGRG